MSENLQIPTFDGHTTKCELHDNPDEVYIFIDVASGTENLCSGAAMVSLPGVGIQPLTGLHYSAKKVEKYRMYEQLAQDCFATLVEKQGDDRYSKNTVWVLVTDNNQLVTAFEDDDPKLTRSVDDLMAANSAIEVVAIDWTPNQDCPCMKRTREYATTLLRQKQKLKAKNMKHYRPDIDRKMRGIKEKPGMDRPKKMNKPTQTQGAAGVPAGAVTPAFKAPGQRRTVSVSENDLGKKMAEQKKVTQEKKAPSQKKTPSLGKNEPPIRARIGARKPQKKQARKIQNNPFMTN